MAEFGIKGTGKFLLVFLEKPMYEDYLERIQELVGDKRSTVCTHRYTDCLLENMSTKHTRYIVNKKNSSILMISVSDNFWYLESGWFLLWFFGLVLFCFLFFYKIRFICPLCKTRYLYQFGHSFFMIHSSTNSFNLSFRFEWGIVGQRLKSNILTLLQEETGLDSMHSNRYLQFFRIHI